MFRRTLTSIICIAVLLCLTIPAMALQTGRIRVETNGGTVALYRVGQINGQGFLLLEAYGGGYLDQGDILSNNLAAWLNEQAKNGHIKATDVWGNAEFDDVETGLYLIAQPSTPSGQEAFAPFLVAMPWDGYVWDINLDLDQLPQTGETNAPAIWICTMLISALGIAICMQYRWKITI